MLGGLKIGLIVGVLALGYFSYTGFIEECLKQRRRTSLFIGALLATLIVAYSAYLDRQVAVRNHNLDVFYKSLTCGDLPLDSDHDEEECEQAIEEFLLEESELFTR